MAHTSLLVPVSELKILIDMQGTVRMIHSYPPTNTDYLLFSANTIHKVRWEDHSLHEPITSLPLTLRVPSSPL